MPRQKFTYRIILYFTSTEDQRVFGPPMEYDEDQFKDLVSRIHKVYKDPNSTFETVDIDGNAVFIPSRNISYITLEKN